MDVRTGCIDYEFHIFLAYFTMACFFSGKPTIGPSAPILANEKLPNGRCRVRVVKEKDSNMSILVPSMPSLDGTQQCTREVSFGATRAGSNPAGTDNILPFLLNQSKANYSP